MKKIVLALIAVISMSVTTMAQDENASRGERRHIDRTEMMKKRTDEMVKKYGLDEQQAQKLLELNTQYEKKMGPGRGPRPDGEGGRRTDMKKGQRPDSLKGGPRRGPGMMEGNREKMREVREAYDKELQTILTEEQYKAYKADEEKRMKEAPRGFNGQRPRRGNGTKE